MNSQTAREWLLEQPTTIYCGPAHMCDAMSGCVQGVVSVATPHGAYVSRLAYCLRPGDAQARVLVSTTGDLDRPMFTSRFVARGRVRPIADDGADVSQVMAEGLTCATCAGTGNAPSARHLSGITHLECITCGGSGRSGTGCQEAV